MYTSVLTEKMYCKQIYCTKHIRQFTIRLISSYCSTHGTTQQNMNGCCGHLGARGPMNIHDPENPLNLRGAPPCLSQISATKSAAHGVWRLNGQVPGLYTRRSYSRQAQTCCRVRAPPTGSRYNYTTGASVGNGRGIQKAFDGQE